jgi:antirestriction protein ArdC
MSTDEARAALDTLHASIAKVTDSDAWRAHLAVQARFHDYSPLNIMWMWCQWEGRRAENPDLPEFSQPAAFSAWKDLGRHVRKGEKPLSVLAPVIVKDRDTGESKCVRFKVKRRTFDLAQTEGADLPENPAMPTLLTGEGDPATWAALVAHAATLGVTVEVTDACQPANGDYNRATSLIRVAAHLDHAQQVKTLMHEVAHATLHSGESDLSRAEKEVEAESTAFVLAALLGFDTAAYSVGYVATWASREDRGEVLRRTTERVVKAARAIAAALVEHSTTLAA